MVLKKILKRILTEKQFTKLKSLKKYSPVELSRDVQADFRLLCASKIKSKNVKQIRVGFVVQVPEIWDKESPIYDAMDRDDSFSPTIVVVPSYNFVDKSVETSYRNNYFLDNYPDAIKALEDGKWIDLEEMKFDYIFLQRPYDYYLPKGFRSGDIARHSKVCYIPYGFAGSEVFDTGNTNKHFFRNVSFSFMESEHMVKALKRQFVFHRENGIRKILNIGYPALIPYFCSPQTETIKTILWTPRWSFDSAIGGSNFIRYKNAFLELAKHYSDIQFVFRPHPLMFEEITNKRIMSETEVVTYLNRLESVGVEYDRNTPLMESLKKADLLITDYSSIIIQYYVTGRPIIYCDSNITFNEEYEKIKKDIIVVETEDQLNKAIKQVIEDKNNNKVAMNNLKEFEYHKNAVTNIINTIKNDYGMHS